MDNLFEGMTPTSGISNPLGGGGTNTKPVNQGDVFPPSAFSPNGASTNQSSGFGDNGFGGSGFGGGFGDNGFGGGSGFSSIPKPQPQQATQSAPKQTSNSASPPSNSTVTPKPSGIRMNGGATTPPPKTQSTVPGNTPQSTSQVPQNAQVPKPQSTTTPRPYTTEEINASRERAVRKFSSIILGGLEYIPLVLGNINQATFVTYLELLTLGSFVIQLFTNYVLALSNKIPMFITMILVPVNTLIFFFVRYYHVIQQKRLERAQELASLEQNESYFSEQDIQQEPEPQSDQSILSSFQPKFTTPEPMYTPTEFHSFEVTPQEENVTESNEGTLPPLPSQSQPIVTPVQFQDSIPDETPSIESENNWRPMQSPRAHSTSQPTEPTKPQQETATLVAQEEPQQSTSNEFGTQSFGFGGNFMSGGFDTGFGQVTPFEATSTETTIPSSKSMPSSEPAEPIRETQTLTPTPNIKHQDTQPIAMPSFEEYTPKEVDLAGTVLINEHELLEADSLTKANDRLSSLSQDITNLLDSLRL